MVRLVGVVQSDAGCLVGTGDPGGPGGQHDQPR